MTTIVEFLLERIESDEEAARRAGGGEWGTASFAGGTAGRSAVVTNGVLASIALGMPDSSVVAWTPGPVELLTNAHIARWDPVRVLAECEAKRQLIARVLNYEADLDGEWGCGHGADQIRAGECEDHPVDEINALRLLALPYAAHPDFDPSWGA